MKYDKWKISPQVVTATEKAFLRGRFEVFAIWTALRADTGFISQADVARCIVPAQTPGVTSAGVWVHIEGQELQRIQLENFKYKERSVIQLHTHPSSNVNMSQLDRDWEVVRHVGALSIIVPFYGASGLSLFENANVYEREESDWRLWSRNEAIERLVLS